MPKPIVKPYVGLDYTPVAEAGAIAAEALFEVLRALADGAEPTPEQAEVKAAFTATTRLEPTAENGEKCIQRWNTLKRLPPPEIAAGMVREAGGGFPAHVAPESGGPTRAVLATNHGSHQCGKPILVRNGAVVKTVKVGELADLKDPRPYERARSNAPPTFYTVANRGVSTLADILKLAKGSQADPNCIWQWSPLSPEYPALVRGIRRAGEAASKYGVLDNFTTGEDASCFFAGDIENVAVPDDMDLTDIAALGRLVRSCLPDDFDDVAFVLGLTTGHGRPTKRRKADGSFVREVRLRVFAILDRPVSSAFRIAWVPPLDVRLVVGKTVSVGADAAQFSRSQAIYINRLCYGARTFEPRPDPYADIAWSIIPGASEVVRVPDEATVRERQAERRARRLADESWRATSRDDFTLKEIGALDDWAGDDLERAAQLATEDAQLAFVNERRARTLGLAEGAARSAQSPRAQKARAKKGAAAGSDVDPGAAGEWLTAEEALARIGDHDGGEGFHAAMLRARMILWADRRHPVEGEGGDAREAAMAELLRVQVEAAEFDPSRHGSTREENLAGIPAMVRSGRERETTNRRQREAKRDSKAGQEAAYRAAAARVAPEPAAAPDEAQAGLRAMVERFDVFHRRAAGLFDGASLLGPLPDEDELPNTPYWMMLASLGLHDLDGGWGRDAAERCESALSDLDTIERAPGLSPLARRALGDLALNKHGVQMRRPVLSLKVGVGIGKTRALIDFIKARLAAGDPRTFAIMAPTMALAEEIAAQIPEAKVYRGIDADGMCVDTDGGIGVLSTKQQRYKSQRLGSSPEGFCKRCPFQKDGPAQCGFYSQGRELKGARVQIYADGIKAMFRPPGKPAKKAGWKPPDFIVLDEATAEDCIEPVKFWTEDASGDAVTGFAEDCRRFVEAAVIEAARLGGRVLTPAQAQNAPRYKAADRYLWKVVDWLERLQRDFEHGLSDKGTVLTAARLRKLRIDFSGRLFMFFGVELHELPQELQDRILAGNGDKAKAAGREDDRTSRKGDDVSFRFARYTRTCRRLELLADCFAQLDLDDVGDGTPHPAGTPVPGWEFSIDESEIGEDGKVGRVGGESHRCLSAKLLKRPSKDWQRPPVVHLDATSRAELTPFMFPGGHVLFTATAREVAVTRHMRFCRSGMKVVKTEAYARSVDRWARVQCELVGAGNVGVVIPKATLLQILELEDTACAAARGAGREPPGPRPYLVLTHGATRGLNTLQDVRVLGVFGRMLVSSAERAATATALTGEVHPAAEPDKALAAFTVKERPPLIGERWSDDSSAVADALCRGAEDSVIQADGRARGARRTAANPVTIFLFVDACVEGLAVDTVEGAAGELVDFGDQAIVHDALRLAAEIGLGPLGKRGSRWWRTLLTLDATADGSPWASFASADAWSEARRRMWRPVTRPPLYRDIVFLKEWPGYGSLTLGDYLDEADERTRTAAEAEPARPVFQVATPYGLAFIGAGSHAAEAVIRTVDSGAMGLVGRERTRALRNRAGEASAAKPNEPAKRLATTQPAMLPPPAARTPSGSALGFASLPMMIGSVLPADAPSALSEAA